MSLIQLSRLLDKITLKIPKPWNYPDYQNLEFQYLTGSLLPDRICVFYKKKKLFIYNWIDGIDAIMYSPLWYWHSIYNSKVVI